MSARNEQDHEYSQPTLDGLGSVEQEETLLYNCLVLEQPRYTDTGEKQLWLATVHAEPCLFQPEIDTVYFASASNRVARLARRKSLKPGDRVSLTGVVRVDTMIFPTGETKTIHRIALTAPPGMVAKEKRVSTTVFAQKRSLRNS
jgi:hypothetical protein